jgi:trk system potassium uptake protein
MSSFVLIVGGGKVGRSLARSLLEEGYEVSLVEDDRHKWEHLEDEFEHAAVLGDGTEITALERAGIARADFVIAVTGDDEDNIIISQLAREKYGLENVIARVNDPRNQAVFDRLGIGPTVCAASHIHSLVEHHLPHHRLLSLLEFSEENLSMVELVLTAEAPAVGKKVRDLCLPVGLLLAVVFRGREALVPYGDMVLQAGDHLVVILEMGREAELGAITGEC